MEMFYCSTTGAICVCVKGGGRLTLKNRKKITNQWYELYLYLNALKNDYLMIFAEALLVLSVICLGVFAPSPPQSLVHSQHLNLKL